MPVRKLPFREMRHTLNITRVQVGLLLAFEGAAWSQEEYALFFVMNEMVERTDNPTYTQYIGIVGAWLRFYKRLIERLPEGDPLRVNSEGEYEKLSTPYKELLPP